jgi:hypothetical protein
MSAVSLPRYRGLSDAGTLALKAFALVWMVADHVDWLLFDATLGIHRGVGRIVFPLFAYVLAWNLARVSDPRRILTVLVPRMLAVGLVSHPFYASLLGAHLPLNVMFTLAAGAAVVAFLRMGQGAAAAAVFVLAGALVDYAWFGLGAIAFAWWWFSTTRSASLTPLVVIAILLVPINDSLWALFAIPMVWMATRMDGPAPRLKWLFYLAYPAHLAALWAVAAFAG